MAYLELGLQSQVAELLSLHASNHFLQTNPSSFIYSFIWPSCDSNRSDFSKVSRCWFPVLYLYQVVSKDQAQIPSEHYQGSSINLRPLCVEL